MAGAAVTLLLLSQSLWSATEFFRLENLRPGMNGVGKTCYRGSKPEEFQVEILGILRGISPGSNAILARLSGGPLGDTGVFEGMSGSPVFIEGKLVGAVAFSFPFAKEAIGGIRPIAEMVDTFYEPLDSGPTEMKVILKKSMLWDYRLPFLQVPGKEPPFVISARDVGLQPSLVPFEGHALEPIATPLSLGGFSAEAVKVFASQLRAMGLMPLQGSAGSAPQGGASAKPSRSIDTAPIEPGSNIVVPLIRGDYEASAAGTVTHIDGNKLYAFGHGLLHLGNTELPLHKGRAMVLLPSLQSSFKIVETMEPVGTIRQDRNSGIYGILGQKARMIPVRVEMTTSRGAKRDLNYEVARDRFLTPLLTALTMFNTIISSERAQGISTLRVKGKISVKGEQPVLVENRFSSDSNAPVAAALAIAIPVNFLFSSGYKNLEFEKIDVAITAVEEDRTAVLDALRIDRSEIKAGDTVDLEVFYRKNNGETVRDSFPVKVPPDVTPGTLMMLVADGTSLMAADAREQGDELIPRDLSQLIKFINNIRKNDRLYVRLLRREPGVVVRGEGLPGLPPSILSIFRSERSEGGMIPIQTSSFMEYEFPPSDYVVSGSKTIDLLIKP